MISRYLFRDDVLIATGTSMSTFDEVAKKDDHMLAIKHPIVGTEFYWSSFRMACFMDNTWGCWVSMPEDETARLRALLLIQQ